MDELGLIMSGGKHKNKADAAHDHVNKWPEASSFANRDKVTIEDADNGRHNFDEIAYSDGTEQDYVSYKYEFCLNETNLNSVSIANCI